MKEEMTGEAQLCLVWRVLFRAECGGSALPELPGPRIYLNCLVSERVRSYSSATQPLVLQPGSLPGSPPVPTGTLTGSGKQAGTGTWKVVGSGAALTVQKSLRGQSPFLRP